MKRSLKRGGNWWSSKHAEPAEPVTITEPTNITEPTKFEQQSYGELVAKVATKLRGDPEAMGILTSAVNQNSNESDKITLLKYLDGLKPEALKQHLNDNKKVYGLAGGRKSRRRRNKSRKQRKSRR